jgi:hypothetical protein
MNKDGDPEREVKPVEVRAVMLLLLQLFAEKNIEAHQASFSMMLLSASMYKKMTTCDRERFVDFCGEMYDMCILEEEG